MASVGEVIKDVTEVVREAPEDYRYFRLRARILRDPATIATDDELRATNALKFSLRPGYIAGALVAVINLIFTGIYAVLGFGTEAANILGEAHFSAEFLSLFNQVFSVVLSVGVTMAAALSATFVARFAHSDDLQQFGVRELRRRFLLALGALGAWPGILLAGLLALVLNVLILVDALERDGSKIDFMNDIGRGLWDVEQWWESSAVADRLGLAQAEFLPVVAGVVLALLFLWAIFNALIATPGLFARSLSEPRPGRGQIALRARVGVTVLIVQPILNALVSVLSYVLAFAIAVALYVGVEYGRYLLGWQSEVEYQQKFDELDDQFDSLTGWRIEDFAVWNWFGSHKYAVIVVQEPQPYASAPPPPLPPGTANNAPCTAKSFRIYFSTDISEMTETAAEVADDVAKQYAACSARQIVIAGHSDGAEAAGANAGVSLARARTVSTYLSAHGVPAAVLKVEDYGFSAPAIPTGAGEKEPLNRFVSVDIN